jgi:hypothetical protein
MSHIIPVARKFEKKERGVYMKALSASFVLGKLSTGDANVAHNNRETMGLTQTGTVKTRIPLVINRLLSGLNR